MYGCVGVHVHVSRGLDDYMEHVNVSVHSDPLLTHNGCQVVASSVEQAAHVPQLCEGGYVGRKSLQYI